MELWKSLKYCLVYYCRFSILENIKQDYKVIANLYYQISVSKVYRGKNIVKCCRENCIGLKSLLSCLQIKMYYIISLLCAIIFNTIKKISMSLTWNKRKRISIFTGDYNTQKINTNENSEVKVRGKKGLGTKRWH